MWGGGIEAELIAANPFFSIFDSVPGRLYDTAVCVVVVVVGVAVLVTAARRPTRHEHARVTVDLKRGFIALGILKTERTNKRTVRGCSK